MCYNIRNPVLPSLQKISTPPLGFHELSHYYGDIVRRIFVGAAIIMIITTPFVIQLLPVPLIVTVFAALVLIAIAALTSPTEAWSAELNVLTSVVAFVLFQYQANKNYLDLDGSVIRVVLFVVNELLALLFLVALYYSGKTFRYRVMGKSK